MTADLHETETHHGPVTEHVHEIVIELGKLRPQLIRGARMFVETVTVPTLLLYILLHTAGLFWGLVQPNAAFAFQIKVFLLVCVIVAGLYGAASVSRKILFVQAAPAVLALAFVWLA